MHTSNTTDIDIAVHPTQTKVDRCSVETLDSTTYQACEQGTLRSLLGLPPDQDVKCHWPWPLPAALRLAEPSSSDWAGFSHCSRAICGGLTVFNRAAAMVVVNGGARRSAVDGDPSIKDLFTGRMQWLCAPIVLAG